MEYILILTGLIIGGGVFFYLFTLYESGKEKIKSNIKGVKPAGKPDIKIEPGTVAYRNMKAYPKERICPLCGSMLTKFEGLYAARLDMKEGRRILIYGCRYCFKSDENPDVERKSEF
jgi:hypothetical protein